MSVGELFVSEDVSIDMTYNRVGLVCSKIYEKVGAEFTVVLNNSGFVHFKVELAGGAREVYCGPSTEEDGHDPQILTVYTGPGSIHRYKQQYILVTADFTEQMEMVRVTHRLDYDRTFKTKVEQVTAPGELVGWRKLFEVKTGVGVRGRA